MFLNYRRNFFLIGCLMAALTAVSSQGGGTTWPGGNGAGAGAGVWTNAQSGSAGMHPPGNLGGSDPQYSYGFAGIDSRGPYGGAGGNGGYYVSSTDEHGRPFSYNGGMGGQPISAPPPPGYLNNYGYRSSATCAAVASVGVTLALALLTARA